MSRRALLRIVFVTLVLAIPVTIYYSPQTASWIYGVIALLAPLWLPVLLVCIAVPLWLSFIRSHFLFSIPYSVIELKAGEETPQSARAMELALYSLYHREEITPAGALFRGKVRAPWAFELSAHAGGVRFFMHLPTAHRASVEARIRAEYRDIDIDEARDYAREINFSPFSMRLLMREYSLGKPDPYPLKTYVAHEKLAQKRDVFNEFLQDLTHISEHEHLFVSWIVRSHQRERKSFFGEKKLDTLHEAAREEIMHLVGHKGDMRAVPDGTKAVVAAIEAALQKPSFDCGVRVLYMAERKHFQEDRAEKLDTLLARFNDEQLNGFISYDPRDQISWPLSELFIAAPVLAMEYFLQLYRRRAFFAPPYWGRAFVLNTEELATVYHLPHISRQSALAGMRGLKLEPPENLPV